MKKICLLLLLAFCMSFCPVVSADVDSHYAYVDGYAAVDIDYLIDEYHNGNIPLNFKVGSSISFKNSKALCEFNCSSSGYDYYDSLTYLGDKLLCHSEKRIKCKSGGLVYAGLAYEGNDRIFLCFISDNSFDNYCLNAIDFVDTLNFTVTPISEEYFTATITMSLNNVSDPLTDDFYVEVENGYPFDGYIKTQYQSNSDDDYTSVKEVHVPASSTTKFTAKELNITKAGIYTFSLYDPDSYLKGIQILEITTDYVAPDDDDGDSYKDLFNFKELPEDANMLDYVKWFCLNMLELFKGIGRCFKKFFTETKSLSQMLTEFFSFMPTEFTLILTFGIMFLVLLRFLGR